MKFLNTQLYLLINTKLLLQGSPSKLRKMKTCCEDGCPNQGNVFKLNFPNSKTYLKEKVIDSRENWRFSPTGKKSRHKIEKYEYTKCRCSKIEERSRNIVCHCFDKIRNYENVKCQCSDTSIKKIKNNSDHKLNKTQLFELTRKGSKKIHADTSTLYSYRDNGCSCCYPPSFKHFSCAGQINGSCDCSENAGP